MTRAMPKDQSAYNHRVAAAARQVAPFAIAGAAAPLAAIGGAQLQSWAVALGFGLLVTASMGMVAGLAIRPSRFLEVFWVFGSLVAVTLLVYGVGGTDSGATLVLLVPVIWMALYGSRLDALVTLALMLTALIGLIITDGTTELLPADIRRIVVFLTVPTLAALTVSNLVQRLGLSEKEALQGQEVLTIVATSARVIREAQDCRRAACEALVDVSGASSAILLEPSQDNSDKLEVTTTVGSRVMGLHIPLSEPSVAGSAFNSGLPAFVADATSDDRVGNDLVDSTGAGSFFVQPFGHGGAVRGVLEMVWNEPRAALDTRSTQAVAVLAQEIGSAFERADLLSTLHRRATTDPLTGLSNRLVWREGLPDLMGPGGALCVALIDLDFFKIYNDTNGHLAGDELLRALGRVWRETVRPQDMLVRWGGEEFALALPDCPVAEAEVVLGRLSAAVPSGQTVSAGLAHWNGKESIESLMTRADTALYEAKADGRNRVVIARSTDVQTVGMLGS